MTGTIEHRLAELGITLPDAAAPAANYVPTVLSGGFLHVSGQLPMQAGKLAFTGKLGADVAIEQGAEAARCCAVNIIAQARAALGDLGRIDRIVKLVGFVNSTADFTDQPKVINGASDLMVEVFGENGRHARSAVSAAALPFNAAVEVEAVIRVT